MAIIKLSVQNPTDKVATFDQVKFYEADDSSGTNATLVTTANISTSYCGPTDPGFTTYVYTSGSTSKYYASKFYNSSSGSLTDYSDWVLGGKDRWDTMFETEMEDSSNAVWSQATIAQFKKWALNALFPELFRQVIDTSLTLDNDDTPAYTYTVPYGIFQISEVGIGDIQNDTSTFQIVVSDNWTFENDVLHFKKLPSSEDNAAIRLVAHRRFLEVGEVPEKFDEIVLHHMKMSAYLNLAEDFPRFKTWAQYQQGTKVSFENLRVSAREFERKFQEGKLKASEMLYPSLI